MYGPFRWLCDRDMTHPKIQLLLKFSWDFLIESLLPDLDLRCLRQQSKIRETVFFLGVLILLEHIEGKMLDLSISQIMNMLKGKHSLHSSCSSLCSSYSSFTFLLTIYLICRIIRMSSQLVEHKFISHK